MANASEGSPGFRTGLFPVQEPEAHSTEMTAPAPAVAPHPAAGLLPPTPAAGPAPVPVESAPRPPTPAPAPAPAPVESAPPPPTPAPAPAPAPVESAPRPPTPAPAPPPAPVPVPVESAPLPPPQAPAPAPVPVELDDRAAEVAARAAATAKDLGSAAGDGLAKAGQNVSEASRTLSKRRSKGVRNTPNRRRLRVELTVFSIRLQASEARAVHREPWMDAADTLTLGAAEAVKNHETIEGWSLLWAAEREAMEGMRPEELVAEGDAAVREARYLLGAQQAEAVTRSLEAPEDEGSATNLTGRVRGARDLLDRMRIETYRRLREEGRRLSGLGLLVLGFLLAAGFAVGLGVVEGADGEALGGLDDLLAVAGFGACGAVVSMLVPWSSSNNRPAILDFVNPTDLTVLRVATGAALAVALVVVLQVIELSDIVGAQAYPWAFAAGFGERIIDKRLDAVDAAARDTEAG